MKKILVIILSISLMMLTACGGKKSTELQSVIETTSDTTAAHITDSLKANSEQYEAKDTDGEMIINGTFDEGTVEPWMLYIEGGEADINADDGKISINIAKTGTVRHGVQLYEDGFSLIKGCKYKVQFNISSTINRSVEFRIQLNGGDYHAYNEQHFDVTESEQNLVFEFTMEDESDPAPRMVFNCGLPDGIESLPEHSIYVDNISLTMIDSNEASLVQSDKNEVSVEVDQVGYRTNDKKVAVFKGDKIDKVYEVVCYPTNKVLFKGDIVNTKSNVTAGEINAYGDFSKLNVPGEYFIRTENCGESYHFKIADDVYDEVSNEALLMLYKQRCGTAISKEIAGEFAHSACHTDGAKIYGTDTWIDVTGGWHDAGDYGKYVVPGAKAVADLLLAYEYNKYSFGDNSGIPESGNNVPDVLDEVRYELNWMLKMQDKSSGGVYHKVTAENFAGIVKADEDNATLIVSPISNTATGDFSAVMAMAYTSFTDIDKTFAERCLKASEKAYDYLMNHENGEGFKNPEGIVTGEYGDSKDIDERYFAAAALYKATKDKKYSEEINKIINDKIPEGFGWADVGFYGSVEYLSTDKTIIDNEVYERIKKTFIKKADEYVQNSESDGYKISIGENYVWGSNMSVANNAMLLYLADSISHDDKYINSATDHLHYLLGRNPVSICYVTGFGTVSPENPHHRPSQAAGSAVTGMLVGGPDKNLEDPYAKNVLKDEKPAKCYADNEQSYSTNEVTIYWNSPLVYLLSSMK